MNPLSNFIADLVTAALLGATAIFIANFHPLDGGIYVSMALALGAGVNATTAIAALIRR